MVDVADNFDEAVVIRRVLEGAVNDFELLVGRYQEKVGRMVARRVPVSDAAAVAQDVFVRAFKSLERFSGRSPFEHWLSRITLNCCRDYWRRRGRGLETVSPPDDGRMSYQAWLDTVCAADGAGEIEAAAALEESKRALELALGGLPPDERWLIESHYYEGTPLKELAVELGWSLVKTKVRAMRARRKMGKFIDKKIKEWSK